MEKTALREDYDHFLKSNHVYSEKATHKALVDSGKDLGLAPVKINRGAERGWTLPPLPEMREAFERRIGSSELFN
jgi:hypothetical protein